MERLSGGEPCAVVSRLMDLATCCVCLEQLSPSLFVCVKGHAVCHHCHPRLRRCPVCQASFSEHKPTLLVQLVEALPHECVYKGCSVMVQPGDDHEEWCGYSTSECRKCVWTGKGMEIINHLQEQHPDLYIFGENNDCNLIDFDPDIEICDYAPFFACGHLFWAECSVDLKNCCLEMRYHLVRNGKINTPIYVVLKMRSSKIYLTYKIRLSFDRTVKRDENCVSISLSALHNFIDRDRNLSYQVQFLQKESNDLIQMNM